MAKTELPSPELLRKLLRYEADTGKLYWRERPLDMFPKDREWKRWNARYALREAFTSVTNYGYRQGSIFGRMEKAHRVIWAMVHDEWPAQEIDIINGDHSDTRLSNLRAVSHIENSRNKKKPMNNTSGRMGVHRHGNRRKWQAYLSIDGKGTYLGLFSSFEDACAARAAAEKKHGYHKNHGRD